MYNKQLLSVKYISEDSDLKYTLQEYITIS